MARLAAGEPPAFADRRGRERGDAAALAVLGRTAHPLGATPRGEARALFDGACVPVLLDDGCPPLLTGYFEPVLPGSPRRAVRFRVPLHAHPGGGGPFPTRAEVAAGALDGRGLEVAWLERAFDAFLVGVQGSARVAMPGGATPRLGFAGGNGHPCRSVGRLLVERGAVPAGQMDGALPRAWVETDPERLVVPRPR